MAVDAGEVSSFRTFRGIDFNGHGVADLQSQSAHIFASDNGPNGAACQQQRIGELFVVARLPALTKAQASVLCGRIPDQG
jgi:hypothetical protein